MHHFPFHFVCNIVLVYICMSNTSNWIIPRRPLPSIVMQTARVLDISDHLVSFPLFLICEKNCLEFLISLLLVLATCMARVELWSSCLARLLWSQRSATAPRGNCDIETQQTVQRRPKLALTFPTQTACSRICKRWKQLGLEADKQHKATGRVEFRVTWRGIQISVWLMYTRKPFPLLILCLLPLLSYRTLRAWL